MTGEIKNDLKKIGVAAIVAVFFIIAAAQKAEAAPELLITWHADTFTPAWFMGKALPTANSPITASVELVDNGTIADLSGNKIYWYVNDKLAKSGVGSQRVSFFSSPVSGNTMNVRVEIPGYGSGILKNVKIPVVDPEAVIESPFPGNIFSSPSIEVKGWPFFFNVKSASGLALSWSVNGVPAQNAENPEVLTVNLNSDAPKGANLNIGLTIQAPESIAMTAAKTINLTYIK